MRRPRCLENPKNNKKWDFRAFQRYCYQYSSLSYFGFSFETKTQNRGRPREKRHSSGFILTEALLKDVEHSQELCVTMWCMPGLFWCVALLDYEAHQYCVSCRPLLQPTRRPQDHLTNTSPSVVNNKFMVACFTCYVFSNSSVLSNWSLSICPTQGGACSRVQGAADDCANAHNARSRPCVFGQSLAMLPECSCSISVQGYDPTPVRG